MKIAIATDEDHVAPGFGCAPFCSIVEVEGDQIRDCLLIPNPGGSHAFWADLFFRNSIRFVIAGSMGSTARSIMLGRGIQPVLGVKGPLDDVVRRFAAGGLRVDPATAADTAHADACCACKG
jgi:predicted Fe-Mo cluster-binding NifX family protein